MSLFFNAKFRRPSCDILTDVVDRTDDCCIAENDGRQWTHPGGDEENQDKNTGSNVVRQIIKATTGQIALRHVLSGTQKRQRCERSRIKPYKSDGYVRPRTSWFLA